MARVRTAAPGDRDGILEVVRDAFSSEDRDGREELDIVESTWLRHATPHELELVAREGDAIVGHVLAASGSLGGRDVVAVAPLAVTPAWQGAGIGSALMVELLRRAQAARVPLVLVLGDPAYYGRFGFEPSGPLDISYPPVGAHDPHFQVRRFPGYDPSYRGEFAYCWEAPPD
jgi:putative acetyltransferase